MTEPVPPSGVVLLCFEHFPTDLLTSYGGSADPLPNLDRLATQSTVVDPCYVTTLETTSDPIGTGRYPIADSPPHSSSPPEFTGLSRIHLRATGDSLSAVDDLIKRSTDHLRSLSDSADALILTLDAPGPPLDEHGEIDPETLIAFDAALGPLLETIDSSSGSVLLIVTAKRGRLTPLESAAELNRRRPELCSERVRVPLLIRQPHPIGGRFSGPVQTVDLLPTAFDFLGTDASTTPSFHGLSLLPVLRTERVRTRTRFVISSPSETVLQADGFLLVIPTTEDDEPPRLYLKPEDRYELADRASEFAEKIEPLRELLGEFHRLRSNDDAEGLRRWARGNIASEV